MFSELKEKVQNRLTIVSNENRLTNFVISMFETIESTNNPFFSNWQYNDFEELLLYSGAVAIWYDELEENGQYVFSQVNFIGNIDFQGIGKDANCTTYNGHNKVFNNWKTNKDVVIIFNNESHSGDSNIERYADLQSETWKSIRSAVQGTRYSKLISVNDEKTKKAVESAIDGIKEGKPMVAMSSNLGIFEENDGQTINAVKLTDFNESDKLQYLSALSTWIERDFINKYGMASQGIDKIAQQNSAEIENGALSSWVEVISRLKARQEGFKMVKEYFGLDITVNLSEVWQKEYNRLFNTKKLETEKEEGGENDN